MGKKIEAIVENAKNGIYVKITDYNKIARQEIIDEFNEIVTSFMITDNATLFLIREIDDMGIIFQKGNRNGLFPKTYFNYFVDVYTGSDSEKEYTRIMSNSKKEAIGAFYKTESMLKRAYNSGKICYFDVEYMDNGITKMMTQRDDIGDTPCQ